MLKDTPSWTTSDGKHHVDYLKALKQEVVIWLTKATENEVISRKIVDALTPESIGGFVDLLEEIEDEYRHPSQFCILKADTVNPGPRFLTDPLFEEVPVKTPSTNPPVVQPLLSIVPNNTKTTVANVPVDISKFG